MRAIRLSDHFRELEPWTPRLVAELNGQHVKLARLEGEFVWHAHAAEDELFLVLEGRLEMHLRDRVVPRLFQALHLLGAASIASEHVSSASSV